jgi:ABC-type Mn2+/Zn2+ transport system permease subunit
MMELWSVPFLRHILIAGLLVAVGLSPLSVYVVLRRIVFSGAAVAEVASAAVALAVLFQIAPFPLALALTVVSFLALSRLASPTQRGCRRKPWSACSMREVQRRRFYSSSKPRAVKPIS